MPEAEKPTTERNGRRAHRALAPLRWRDVCGLFGQVCAGEDNAKSWTTLEKIVQKERRFIPPSKVNDIFREGLACGGLICKGRKICEDDNLPVGKVQYYCRDGEPSSINIALKAAEQMDKESFLVSIEELRSALYCGWPCITNYQEVFAKMLRLNEELRRFELMENDMIRVYPDEDGPGKGPLTEPDQPTEPPTKWGEVESLEL